MSRYHLPFQWMKNFKAIAIDYEYYLTLGDEGRLYCLTDRQIYILYSQVEAYIGWLTRWYNPEDINQLEVGFIQSDLLDKLMSCVDIQILIDQAKITASYEATNQQIQSAAVRQILIDRYDGTPTSINPSAPSVFFGAMGDRYDALCAAIAAFVYKFAANQANVIRLNEVGGAAAVALIAALLIPGLNIFLLVGAGIAVLLGFGVIGVSSETAIAALTDQAALNDVICFMRDTLRGEAVTEANWNACLDSYPFGVGTHQAIVADFIKATLPDNYLSVLDMLGQGYDSVLAGDDLPECPCVPTPRVQLVNGAPSIWPVMSIVFVGVDPGDTSYDVFDIASQAIGFGVLVDGVTYFYGSNVVRDIGGGFHIEEVSNMAAQSSNTTIGSDSGTTFNPTLLYTQVGMFTGAAGTTRVRVKA